MAVGMMTGRSHETEGAHCLEDEAGDRTARCARGTLRSAMPWRASPRSSNSTRIPTTAGNAISGPAFSSARGGQRAPADARRLDGERPHRAYRVRPCSPPTTPRVAYNFEAYRRFIIRVHWARVAHERRGPASMSTTSLAARGKCPAAIPRARVRPAPQRLPSDPPPPTATTQPDPTL